MGPICHNVNDIMQYLCDHNQNNKKLVQLTVKRCTNSDGLFIRNESFLKVEISIMLMFWHIGQDIVLLEAI